MTREATVRLPDRLRQEVRAWIEDDPSEPDRAELRELLTAAESDATAAAELADRFADRLHFGTAGLRGALRAGPAGMNVAVVGRAAAGLTSYLDSRGAAGSVVIGYDARHGSAEFARVTAEIVAGSGREALLLPGPLPTPVLAFAVRRLDAASGVMVTASHNPPRDNGYKVYLGGSVTGDEVGAGAQIVPPDDERIEAAIAAVGRLADVPRATTYAVLDASIVDSYVGAVAALPRGAARDLGVTSTPLHGVGADVLAAVFARAGFAPPVVVPEQARPDPDFPTVGLPNPEEPGVLDLALALGRERGADLVIATDPDADRCAVAVGGRLLTGDELGVLLADHLMTAAGPGGLFATTIVSSSMLGAMCAARGVAYAETLTGFKWIVRAGAGLTYGYEEAIGYCVAPSVVRDKDGIAAAVLAADMAATLKARGRTLLDRLGELQRDYAVHATDQLAVRMDDGPGDGGAGEIEALMRRLRADSPAVLAGEPVTATDLRPATDALRYCGTSVRAVVRPSGTEAKLKCYLQAVVPVDDDLEAARAAAAETLARLRADMSAALGLGSGLSRPAP